MYRLPAWQRIGFVLIILAFLWIKCVSCSYGKEYQGEAISVVLVKLDTVYRYPSDTLKLTWHDKRTGNIITWAPIPHAYKVGMRIPAIVLR